MQCLIIVKRALGSAARPKGVDWGVTQVPGYYLSCLVGMNGKLGLDPSIRTPPPAFQTLYLWVYLPYWWRGTVCRLEILYLGGNRLTSLPAELGRVTSLVSLVVSDNELTALPRTLTSLSSLQSLSLHNNRLATLPPDIIRLPLVELSLRNNPLVVKFVEELTYDAPSLLELAGRCVKLSRIQYSSENIPASLVHYLDSAQSCVNPRCNGTVPLVYTQLLTVAGAIKPGFSTTRVDGPS